MPVAADRHLPRRPAEARLRRAFDALAAQQPRGDVARFGERQRRVHEARMARARIGEVAGEAREVRALRQRVECVGRVAGAARELLDQLLAARFAARRMPGRLRGRRGLAERCEPRRQRGRVVATVMALQEGLPAVGVPARRVGERGAASERVPFGVGASARVAAHAAGAGHRDVGGDEFGRQRHGGSCRSGIRFVVAATGGEHGEHDHGAGAAHGSRTLRANRTLLHRRHSRRARVPHDAGRFPSLDRHDARTRPHRDRMSHAFRSTIRRRTTRRRARWLPPAASAAAHGNFSSTRCMPGSSTSFLAGR
jgi:hypothetical protein